MKENKRTIPEVRLISTIASPHKMARNSDTELKPIQTENSSHKPFNTESISVQCGTKKMQEKKYRDSQSHQFFCLFLDERAVQCPSKRLKLVISRRILRHLQKDISTLEFLVFALLIVNAGRASGHNEPHETNACSAGSK